MSEYARVASNFARKFVLPLGGFNDEQIPRARRRRALQCRHADTAETDDGDVVTRSDGGRLGGRAPARRHTAADEGRRLERNGLVDLDHRGPVHDKVRRVCSQQRVRVDVLSSCLNAKRAVRHRCSRHQSHAEVAQVALAGLAGPTDTTRGDERSGNVITGPQIVDALADLDDDARAFVTAEHRKAKHRNVAGDDVMVGMTHACRLERHLHLTLAWVADLDLLDRPRLVEVPGERTLCFHRRASC